MIPLKDLVKKLKIYICSIKLNIDFFFLEEKKGNSHVAIIVPRPTIYLGWFLGLPKIAITVLVRT